MAENILNGGEFQVKIMTELITAKRKEMKMSQEQFGDEFGISQSMVHHIESQRKFPSLPVFYQMAKFLGLKLDELISE